MLGAFKLGYGIPFCRVLTLSVFLDPTTPLCFGRCRAYVGIVKPMLFLLKLDSLPRRIAEQYVKASSFENVGEFQMPMKESQLNRDRIRGSSHLRPSLSVQEIAKEGVLCWDKRIIQLSQWREK